MAVALSMLTSSRVDGFLVVGVSGELDMHAAPALRQALSQARDEATLIVSLEGVAYIDSSALTELIREQKDRSKRGLRLEIVLPPARLRRVFEITGLDRWLTCFFDLSAALVAARTGTASGPIPSEG